MNKLKTTYPAGVDFNWDDLAWMQDATRDAFYGLLSAFGIDPDESFILSGCVVTIGPSSASTTAGYISLNGEILKVEAHSIVYDGSSPVVWRLQATDDPSGTETDSTASTVQCYQKRVAVLYQASSYTNEMPYNASTLVEVINSRLGLGSWTSVPYNAAYFDGTNLVLVSLNTTIYFKVIGNTMFISFRLSITSMDSSDIIIDIAAATSYSIVKTMHSSGLMVMASNDAPVMLSAYSAGTFQNKIRITSYGADFGALANANIYGEMTLEVQPI